VGAGVAAFVAGAFVAGVGGDAGIGTVGAAAPCVVGNGVGTAGRASRVGAEEMSTALPHELQNRLVSASSTPQFWQSMVAVV